MQRLLHERLVVEPGWVFGESNAAGLHVLDGNRLLDRFTFESTSIWIISASVDLPDKAVGVFRMLLGAKELVSYAAERDDVAPALQTLLRVPNIAEGDRMAVRKGWKGVYDQPTDAAFRVAIKNNCSLVLMAVASKVVQRRLTSWPMTLLCSDAGLFMYEAHDPDPVRCFKFSRTTILLHTLLHKDLTYSVTRPVM